MRTQGSLRLIMNTKIWPGMNVERASNKSVRITGTDGDAVKVFLIIVSIHTLCMHGNHFMTFLLCGTLNLTNQILIRDGNKYMIDHTSTWIASSLTPISVDLWQLLAISRSQPFKNILRWPHNSTMQYYVFFFWIVCNRQIPKIQRIYWER